MSSLDKLILDTDGHDEFLRRLMSSLILSIKNSNVLPNGLEFNYRNSFQDTRQSNLSISNEIDTIIKSLIGFSKPIDQDTLNENLQTQYFYDQIVECIEYHLNKADILLNKAKLSSSSTNQLIKQSLQLDKDSLLHNSSLEIPKPQILFLHEIDNSRTNPFKPRFSKKYHGLSKSDKIIDLTTYLDPETNETIFYYRHPYEMELESLKYPSFLFEETNPLLVLPDPLRSYEFVETEQQLMSLINELKTEREIAVDLEHHSYRTFLGLTCLMQISSRKKNYIVDALSLRKSLHALGDIFANPSIVKVFHGCEKDILWLQRDLGLYVVNCFDTYAAAKVLQFPVLSLAHLAKCYCGIVLNKKYQLADWRQRPLTDEMLDYAKNDTHFLLFIYDSLRKQILKDVGVEGMENVLALSKKFCLGRYEKPQYDPLGYRQLFSNSNNSRSIPKLDELLSIQESALSALWNWRDEQARSQDESLEYIMTSSEFIRISLRLPLNSNELESCAPLSQYTVSHSSSILQLISNLASINTSTIAYNLEYISSPSKNNKKTLASEDDSIYTFTPAITIPQNRDIYFRDNHLIQPSPVLTQEEMFRLAGWKTPSIVEDKTQRNLLGNSISFETTKPQYIIDSERQQLLSRCNEEFSKEVQKEFNDLFQELVAEVRPKVESSIEEKFVQDSIESADNSFSLATEDDFLLEIPKTYEEIYKLAGKNRKKNKDKKRNRIDGEGVGDSLEISPTELAGSSKQAFSPTSELINQKIVSSDGFDYNQYFNVQESNSSNQNVDETLNFTNEIGWIKSKQEIEEMKEDHQRTLSYQQHSEDSKPNSQSSDNISIKTSNSLQAGSPKRKSFDKFPKSNSSTQNTKQDNQYSSSKGFNKPPSKSSLPPNKGTQNNSSNPKGFDYSRSQQIIGAHSMSNSSEGFKGTINKSKQNKSNRGPGSLSSNPYMANFIDKDSK